mmetsp:Transcript_33441/g.77042  ORF Transcript_33441/g.77042 Transcript_33441/m.77042 type:complete len:594 (+) Transcript_33441:2-1783(+)
MVGSWGLQADSNECRHPWWPWQPSMATISASAREETEVEGMVQARGISEWVIPLAISIAYLPGAETQTTTVTTRTTTLPPYQYFSGDWSSCSVTCEVGTRTREVFCFETCTRPRFCKVGDDNCRSFEKPADFEYCWPPVVRCPDPPTTTFTSTLTSTASTHTRTVTSRTTTQEIRAGWECVTEVNNGCVVDEIARVQCGPRCPCCRRSATQVITTRRFDPSAVGGELPTAVIVTVSLTSVVLISGIGVAGWWSCNRAKRVRPPRSHSSRSHSPKAESYGAGTRQSSRTHGGHAWEKEDAVYDRKLGKGVPSAAPDGYFDGPPDWMNEDGEDAGSYPGTRSASRARTATENVFVSEGQAASVNSSPMRKKRFLPEADDPDSRQAHSPRGNPNAPSGTLPPGYASAARRHRRAGKDAPDVDDFAADGQHVPGEANATGSSPKGRSKTNSSAPPPSTEAGKDSSHQEGPRAAGKEDDSQPKGDAKSNRATGTSGTSGNAGTSGASGTSGTTGASRSGDGPKVNPRVATNSAAAPEAFDLIGKVDYELDQTQSKDLETRRRVFKNLILKWHPDKNPDAQAAEVFRHLMARRGRYLEA